MTSKFHTHSLRVPEEFAGMRLDQALARLLPEYSRSRLKEWIEAGRVRVANRAPRPRDLLSGGERVVVEAEPSISPTILPQALDLEIVHEDDCLIVINKPAGLVVHPGTGN
ncbi:MAG TPA: S4 domain-containing protein, partial [Steroidobacteraceae bacterium]